MNVQRTTSQAKGCGYSGRRIFLDIVFDSCIMWGMDYWIRLAEVMADRGRGRRENVRFCETNRIQNDGFF